MHIKYSEACLEPLRATQYENTNLNKIKTEKERGREIKNEKNKINNVYIATRLI